jgi:hypothetical protein
MGITCSILVGGGSGEGWPEKTIGRGEEDLAVDNFSSNRGF